MADNVIQFKGSDQFISFLKKLSFIPILIFLLLLLTPTMVFTVAADEDAVVLRFGKYSRTAGPGIHLKLPFNLEEALKVPVRKILKMEFGFRTVKPGVRSSYDTGNYKQEAIMLTGDLNVVDLTWIIQYQIKDAREFLFNVHNVPKNLFDISQSVVREVVGDRTVTEAIIEARDEIAFESLGKMQTILDEYKMGIRLVALELQDVVPPDKVRPSFDEVNAAVQDAKQIANMAEKQRQKLLQEELGKADQTIKNAEAYKVDLVNRATGDARRFLSLYEEYRKAPEVTEKRLYFVHMQKILNKSKKVYVVDSDLKSIVPFLPLVEASAK